MQTNGVSSEGIFNAKMLLVKSAWDGCGDRGGMGRGWFLEWTGSSGRVGVWGGEGLENGGVRVYRERKNSTS